MAFDTDSNTIARDETHDLRHDLVELEILRRVDGSGTHGFQGGRVLRRNDAADHDGDVVDALPAHPVENRAYQRDVRAG